MTMTQGVQIGRNVFKKRAYVSVCVHIMAWLMINHLRVASRVKKDERAEWNVAGSSVKQA